MDIVGFVRKKLDQFQNQVAQNAFRPTPQQQAIGSAFNSAKNYFSPTYSGTQGFWGTPVAKGLANAQQFIESPASYKPFRTLDIKKDDRPLSYVGKSIYNLPFDIGNTIVGGGILNPISDVSQMIGRGMGGREPLLYGNAKSGAYKVGLQGANLVNPEVGRQYGVKTDFKNVVGDVAQTVEPMANAYTGGKTFGIGKEMVQTAGKQAFSQAVKSGAISGSIYGGVFGLLQGLQQARDTKDNPSYVGQVAGSTATGAVAGAVLGGGVAGAGSLLGKVRNNLAKIVREHTKGTTEEAQKQVDVFLRDEMGRFTGKKTIGKDPIYYGELRKSLGLPEHGEEPGVANLSIKIPDQPVLRVTKGGKYKVDMKEVKLPKEDPFIQGLAKDQTKPNILKAPLEQYSAMEGANMGGGAEFRAQTDKKGFQKLFAEWIGKRDVAKTTGTQTAEPFAKTKLKGEDIIRYIEKPSKKASPELKQFAKDYKAQTDALYKQAKEAGIDIGYVDNYVTHIWKGAPLEIQQAYNQAKQKFSFAKGRTIPTYDEGLKIGKWLEGQNLPNPFIPRYTNPAQILETYTRRLNQVKANLEFFNKLKQEGLVVPASIGRTQYGFKPIEAPGFPHSTSNFEGVNYSGSYYAPGEVADQINKIFSADVRGLAGKAIGVAGEVSSRIQDITLSGGVKNVNAFSSAQALKETLSGRPISALKTYWSTWNPKRSSEFFKSNVEQIKKMQSQNIQVSSTYDIEHMIPSSEIKRTLGQKLGNAWTKAVNEPTFKRFMPTLQIRFFNDVERQALKGGASAEEAVAIAGKATKNFYGLTGTDVQATRSRIGQDAIKTFLFAPRYRESMVNFWVNDIKALKHPLALENRGNVKFVAGALGLYVAMNYANQAFNGKPMWENPPGKEDMLLIPLGNGNTIGVPFLSSIATVPRSLIKTAVHTAQGNFKQAGADLRSNLSMMVKPFADIAVNQNYFGQDIYDDNDAPAKKYEKIGQYLARSYQHPYIGALMDRYTKNDPALVTVSKALELPFRFYKDKSLEAGYYYANRDKYLGQLSPTDKAIYDKLHNGKQVDEDGLPVYNKRSEMANALDRLANPGVLRAESAIAIETSNKTGQALNPFYTLSPKQQETVLTLKTFYPGDKTKGEITRANIDWLQSYWDKRDQYVATLKKQGIIKENSNFPQSPKPSQLVQQKLDYYNTLPSGTGARSAFLRANPDVLQYFTDSRNFTNAQRADLGLPLIADSSSKYGSGGRKGAKISAKSFKKAKIGKVKIAKFKKPKIKKFKVSKVKKLKVAKYKPPKLPKLPSLQS